MNKILVVLFLIAVAIIIVTGVMRNDRDRLYVAPEVPLEERALEVQPAPPELEEIPEVRVEDIPFEQIPEEAIVREEREIAEEDPELDIFPPPEELERLKREGIIIH
ncbi:hypothetical protein M1N41_01995 [Thermodesulfovibrionales bacterium]|nr:hypothetical protein [Thermodesulfovibrionales bacterium]